MFKGGQSDCHPQLHCCAPATTITNRRLSQASRYPDKRKKPSLPVGQLTGIRRKVPWPRDTRYAADNGPFWEPSDIAARRDLSATYRRYRDRVIGGAGAKKFNAQLCRHLVRDRDNLSEEDADILKRERFFFSFRLT